MTQSSIAPTSEASFTFLEAQPNMSEYPKAIQEFFCLNHDAAQEFTSKNCEIARKCFIEENLFRPSASLCIDGRVQDFTSAIGVPAGVTELFRSAGVKTGAESLMHMQRTQSSIASSADFRTRAGKHEPRVMMRFQTVHYSHSFPTTASCAAWEHDTVAATVHMLQLAQELNRAWPGHLIALPVLIDTDLDAITVIGPQGRFGTRELLDLGDTEITRLFGGTVDRLKKLFPAEWKPLQSFEKKFRVVFHDELAGYLLRNLDFVRKVISSGRSPEMLVHQERLIFVGRHADWIQDHNSVFLIDDTASPAEIALQLEIAMKYVAKNILLDELPKGTRDWVIPLVFNVPHLDSDKEATRVYVRSVTEVILRPAIQAAAPRVCEWLIGSHGIPKSLQNGALSVDLMELAQRVSICMSTSHKRTRQFVPFT
ncbi:hypothetical protein IT408_01400 [Candidatus Uhrbacteria bacterium]|nr:hypothetical protein [Candidatus Uhrbacteria bacterium]